jgi:hypothetical protein
MTPPPLAPGVDADLLTPTELVVLLGDRFVGAGSMTKGKYDLLSGAGTVALNPLAEALLQVAFLSLEADGHLRLAHRAGKAMFGLVKTNAVTAERTGAERPAGALEAQLLDALDGMDGPAEVDAVVYHWFGQDLAWPHQFVPPAVVGGLVARGLVAEGEERGLLRKKKTYALTPAGQAALAAASEAPAQALLAAAEARAPLAEHLLREVKQGLRRRTYRGGATDSLDWND